MDQIQVCSPIRFSNMRCNEVKATVVARTARTVMGRGKGQLYLSAPENIQQLTTLLKWPKTVVFMPYVVFLAFIVAYAIMEIYEEIMVLSGSKKYTDMMLEASKSEAEQAIEASLAQEDLDLSHIDYGGDK